MERYLDNGLCREKAFFGFDWQFALTDDTAPPPADVQWKGVQLPHDWSTEYPVEEKYPSCGSGGYVRTGIGWYKKRFTVLAKPGERVSLYFDGVYMNCDVWLNGVHVGGHIYGYTSFEIDVTRALAADENELLVRVNNAQQPNSRWYTGSGITRNVYLCKTQALRITPWGVFITTPRVLADSAEISLEARVLGGGEREGMRLATQILNPKNKTCAHMESAVQSKDDVTVCQRMRVNNPRLWDIDHPALYTAVTAVYQNDILYDTVETRFGIRQIGYDTENGFLLNTRKAILQGVCLHHDGGCVGAAVPPEVWQRRLAKLKAMGVNALRCAHTPPDPALLDLADEMGFVVMDEAFDEWRTIKGKEFGSNTHESRGYSEWFASCWREDMASMLLRDRNHPSIIMWSIGNEVGEQTQEEGWKTARELAGLCRSFDPTRPVTQACDQVKAEPVAAYDIFMEQLDIVGVNYTDRWRERTEAFFDEEKREHPDWLLLGSEDISVGGKRGDYRLKTEESVWGRTPYYAKMLKAEKLWKFIRTRPYVLGSFLWTGIDHLGECFWPDKSASPGVMDTCAFEKDGYYFYQSIWRKDRPVLYLCPHLNLEMEPGTIYPVICYTNCCRVELFVDGKSYGAKAYEFPAQGMTRHWGHFDLPQAPITTNDLHLSWDVPYAQGEMVAIGYDRDGQELTRQRLVKAGKPARLEVRVDREAMAADGRAVCQFEIRLLDEQGNLVPDNDREVCASVSGAALLGMDNGDPADHTLFASPRRKTFRGLAYGIARALREPGEINLRFSAEGLEPVTLMLEAK